MTRVAVVTVDVLGRQMAGPAIRAYQIAADLSGAGHEVTLVSTAGCSITADGFACRYASWSQLRDAVGDAEVVVVQGFVTYFAPWLTAGEQILVIDLYDPVHLEQLELLPGRTAFERRDTLDTTVRILNEQIARGDFFLCASEEQRHLWLGHLAAFGRVSWENYAADNSLRSLLAVCPFGLPAEPPRRTAPAIKGVVPGIAAEDKVILWAGGVYDWFDPLTLVRAVDRVRAEHPDVRLFFLGMRHPNPDVPAMEMAERTVALADELGLTGKHVFFNDGWVAYDERQNYLLDADVGVSTHFDHLETMFSFRTRILDYLWAGLPVVATGGDAFGSIIEAEGLGVTVPERDVPALAEALTRALYDAQFAAECRAGVGRVSARFSWPTVLSPLREFCAAPHRAPDASADPRRILRRAGLPQGLLARQVRRGFTLLRHGGPRVLATRVSARLRRVRAQRGGTTR